MDHNAGPRAACVTILTMLVVFLLSAIAIVFRLDDGTAGALRAALACLLFVYLAYLLFEVKVLQLLLTLLQFQSPAAGNWFYPQPPLSFVGTFSPLGSSVGRGQSLEEASGGRAASPPPPSEAGSMTSEYTAAEPSPAAPYVSGGSYHRRQRLPTGVHRSSSSRRSFDGTWAWPSSGGSSSSEVTEQLTSEEEVEPWMGGSISSSAWGSPSSAGGRRRPRNGGGAMAYTNLKHASSKR